MIKSRHRSGPVINLHNTDRWPTGPPGPHTHRDASSAPDQPTENSLRRDVEPVRRQWQWQWQQRTSAAQRDARRMTSVPANKHLAARCRCCYQKMHRGGGGGVRGGHLEREGRRHDVVMRPMICNTPLDNDDDDGDDDGWITLARAARRLVQRAVPFDGAAMSRQAAIPVQGRVLRASDTRRAISQLFPVGQPAVAALLRWGRRAAPRHIDRAGIVSTGGAQYERRSCMAGHGYGVAKPSVLRSFDDRLSAYSTRAWPWQRATARTSHFVRVFSSRAQGSPYICSCTGLPASGRGREAWASADGRDSGNHFGLLPCLRRKGQPRPATDVLSRLSPDTNAIRRSSPARLGTRTEVQAATAVDPFIR